MLILNNFTKVKVVVIFDVMMFGLPTQKENFFGWYFVNLNTFSFSLINPCLFSCLFDGNDKASNPLIISMNHINLFISF